MYKILIIDDEPWTIIDLESIISSYALDFTVSDSYQSPVKALAAIIDSKPDLVITDIRMPGMTGLELMERVRRQNIDCEFVIISGYSDFNYAKTAISLGARGYCLKPLNPIEVQECLKKSKDLLDEKHPLKKCPDHGEHSFKRLLNYIDIHFSEKLTLKDLASKFYLNPNYCCALFVKYTQQTFSQYLNHLRIEAAEKLLLETEYSLDKIAGFVGFTDYFYFSKVFKRISGCTPKEFRRQKERYTH